MSKHLELVRAVNSSTTEREHDLAEARLQGWREGVEHCGRKWDYIAADEDAETIYPGRPYCCGVLLDWTPAPKFANVFCSQCGQEFGPGDHGFSHCANHKRHNALGEGRERGILREASSGEAATSTVVLEGGVPKGEK